MLRLAAALIAAVLLTAQAPIPTANLSQQPPPAKVQTVGTKKAQQNANRQEYAAKPPPLVVEAHVSGKLETTTNNAGQGTQDEHNPWLDPISIFTFLLVLVGAGQVYFLRNTDKATTLAANAAKASADAVVSQLRAYLHVNMHERPTVAVGQPLKTAVEVKNTGQTPAFDALIVSNAGIVSWPTPRPLKEIFVDTDATDIVRITIPPGEKSLNIPELPDVTAEEVVGIKAGAYRVIVWGRVEYMDTFKNARIVRYAYSLRWEGDNFGLPFFEVAGSNSD